MESKLVERAEANCNQVTKNLRAIHMRRKYTKPLLGRLQIGQEARADIT